MHERVDNADFGIVGVERTFNMHGVKHLRCRIEHDIDNGINNREPKNTFFQMPEDTFSKLQQCNE